MPSTMTFRPGDVIAVRFQFREGERPKPRPAVVVSVEKYNDERVDAVFMAITSSPIGRQFGDCEIVDWRSANLRAESMAKGVFRTIDQRTVKGHIGRLTAPDRERVQGCIRDVFGL